MPWYRIGSGFRQRFVFIDTIGTNARLVGFGLKGIGKMIVFPLWLMFWTFKLMVLMFKALFYTFPIFLWSKGTIGKIGCGVYLFAWSVAIFIESMGEAYVLRNWVYLSIILLAIISSAATSITFRFLDKHFSRRFAVALTSRIFVVGITVLIGMVFTKHLKPLEGEIILIGERHKTEKIQPNPVENESAEG
ncbi:MAG: hypothetical protein LBD22_04020 [Spirochaetaceae bacterium]|jgi:hypothetical protein|nr:hypothetical protein [Spirochaetaceae bacterium]